MGINTGYQYVVKNQNQDGKKGLICFTLNDNREIVLHFETGRMCYGITVSKSGKKPSLEGLPNPETVKNGCGSGSRTCYFEKMNLNRKNYILEPINRGYD